MKPPFSYYGGKQRIVRHILPLIPQHTVYVEPFCGGATVFFAKENPKTTNNVHYRTVLNDTNHLIYNFFSVLRDNFSELKKKIKYSLYSQQEHKLSELNYDDPIEKAYYFYININQSYAKQLNGGWGRSNFGNNEPYIFLRKNKNIIYTKQKLQNSYISCEDALTCIKRWDSPQTFFYCDPPYPGTNQGHYNGYTQQDFENLIETLKGCKGSFLLSCYENETVFKNWEKFEFKTVNTSSNTAKGGHREKRTECVWRRFNTEQPRKEIIDLYNSGKFDCFVRHPDLPDPYAFNF